MVVLQEVEVDLPLSWACLLLVWALFCLVVGLLPLGLMSGFGNVVFLVHFRYISMLFRHVLLQLTNHQNLCNLVSYKP